MDGAVEVGDSYELEGSSLDGGDERASSSADELLLVFDGREWRRRASHRHVLRPNGAGTRGTGSFTKILQKIKNILRKNNNNSHEQTNRVVLIIVPSRERLEKLVLGINCCENVIFII